MADVDALLGVLPGAVERIRALAPAAGKGEENRCSGP